MMKFNKADRKITKVRFIYNKVEKFIFVHKLVVTINDKNGVSYENSNKVININ
jgi:hypothetical protein